MKSSMKKYVIMVPAVLCLAISLTRCREKVSANANDYVGIWESIQVSDGFCREIITAQKSIKSTIIFKSDGSFVAENFPQRDPYRLISLRGEWSIDSGEYTPSGKTSIIAGGQHFVIVGAMSGVKLKNTISGKDDYNIIFAKKNRLQPNK